MPRLPPNYSALFSLASQSIRLTACLAFLSGFPSASWAESGADLEAADAEVSSSETANSETESTHSIAAYYTPDIPKKRAQSLIQYMTLMERQDEIVQLSSPSDSNLANTSLAADYYGLFLADATGNPQGGVLILHDNQQHGHWPDIVAPLREYLPQHGWTTLTIELPDTPVRVRIAREEASVQPSSSSSSSDTNEGDTTTGNEPISSNKEGEPLFAEEAIDNAGPDLQGQQDKLKEDVDTTPVDDSLEPALPKLAKLPDLDSQEIAEIDAPEEMLFDPIEHYRKQNQQRIFTAMEYLRSKGQFNLVIIGYGIGAAWAIDYITQQEDAEEDKKGLTLVTIDALPSRHSSMIMHQQLEKLNVPFLDLIQPEKSYALKQGKIRRAIMNRNKNETYQQIITSNMASYHENENPTNRRIRGWLKTNAGGTLVRMKP